MFLDVYVRTIALKPKDEDTPGDTLVQAFQNRVEALDSLYSYVEENWASEVGERYDLDDSDYDMPEDRDDAIDRYFELVPEEDYEINELSVQFDDIISLDEAQRLAKKAVREALQKEAEKVTADPY